MLQTKFLSADDYHKEKLQHLVPHRIASIQHKQFHAFICSAWKSRISSHTEPSRAELIYMHSDRTCSDILNRCHIYVSRSSGWNWIPIQLHGKFELISCHFNALELNRSSKKQKTFMSSLFRKKCGKLEYIERCHIRKSNFK